MPLSPEALEEKIKASRARNLPLMASWDEIRMSLAGAQEKLGLRIDADGALFLPEGMAASTHIVKPENASLDFPFCPANEFFCMPAGGRPGDTSAGRRSAALARAPLRHRAVRSAGGKR